MSNSTLIILPSTVSMFEQSVVGRISVLASEAISHHDPAAKLLANAEILEHLI